ncbi:MAG: superoxide dismutase [Candidatus Yonathbacteria bacterium RIFOXYC1_FULL_52_10]|uniref:superoxide dismutase n=1 Tax=Candidatus Yonathbacteria bacterium RIFOXYD1_FULL_52_36 TaxID=1802730 RepID=A0A1G2SKH5_9BACT|nr:MAG: superoxide dismutase [Candidatus Yonathbacteria bacterium RIFOXYC1_FULL_52_10]OHA85573.1 MAG: superoxide dismutase [Candidatus Yonathbacteria bacterium RIFOXYD1_FULL_52_36]
MTALSYEAKSFDHLLGTKGFSDALLKNHFTLYQGYVTNTNKLAEALKNAQAGTPEYTELKRRFGWEYNGMRLHELYFGNMTSAQAQAPEKPLLFAAIEEQFGSFDAWAADFKATGAMRGIGWAILVRDEETKRLFNVWVNEHDAGHLAGARPILVMDVFEHAFMLDYGLKRAEYIDAFWNAINWDVAEERFRA